MGYFYGPVFSRRLGFSLGVDVLPKKVCPFGCVYCQLGKTYKRIHARFSYVNLDKLRRELKGIVKKNPRIDYITFSGSGEPTLHKNLDKIIVLVKRTTKHKYPVCVITNSSLLYRKKVREELKAADIIIPSLDAATPSVFKRINRPHTSIAMSKIVNGLISLRKEFKGEIWLEIMLVKGVNDTKKEAERLAELVSKIKPDKIQLNLPVRPAGTTISVPDSKTIAMIKRIIGEKADVVIPVTRRGGNIVRGELDSNILAFILRRPATVKDLSLALGATPSHIRRRLVVLLKAKIIKQERYRNQKYFISRACYVSGRLKKQS